jgi:hypothetical protein
MAEPSVMELRYSSNALPHIAVFGPTVGQRWRTALESLRRESRISSATVQAQLPPSW